METYLVSFQLNDQSDYDKVAERLRTYPKWARVGRSVWFVKSDTKLTDVRESVSSILRVNGGGSVFVMNIADNAWGTYAVEKRVTAWMKENI